LEDSRLPLPRPILLRGLRTGRGLEKALDVPLAVKDADKLDAVGKRQVEQEVLGEPTHRMHA
jgi:hypothetical protein